METLKKTFMDNRKWLLIIAIVLVYDIIKPTDSTDKSRFERSGLSLYKDYGTGCEYLSIQAGMFGKGELIPRVDKGGNHVCN